ncbi:GntR family transcriptional regulator [Micromonospora sp. WMMD980]|uniref:GntR family transcriptional regulator n=1 Tax=Micromonospora sp. WMMD980 TaxID=3016088 RepID=UPI002417634E|nr:GntR family transcriptional regulator [Micromonospora sp. WMMD980]MDG4798983.1 GntR family transcriptional regulator [Micromonospora sp. WMMD980]MDG4799013.1 GntR family transcriptional regulator [Micromonospora sp. WMMD980]MDG4799079.1 GntR family transcriptional regulator [Micromonospora sp. WMMD980]
MLDPHLDRPLFRQLADALRDQIITGQLTPGSAVPSIKALEHRYGVSRETIRRALAALRVEGLVVAERGYGTRVVDEQPREQVKVPRGARVRSRMPTEAERAELGIEPGAVVPVLVVTLGGRVRGVYAADRVELTFS